MALGIFLLDRLSLASFSLRSRLKTLGRIHIVFFLLKLSSWDSFFSCEVINPVAQALDLAILRDKDIIGSSFELKGPPVSLSKI